MFPFYSSFQHCRLYTKVIQNLGKFIHTLPTTFSKLYAKSSCIQLQLIVRKIWYAQGKYGMHVFGHQGSNF